MSEIELTDMGSRASEDVAIAMNSVEIVSGDDACADVSQRPVAVKYTGVKKKYRLGVVGAQTLQGDLESWWARVRGKDDPNVRIGTDMRLVGQEFMALNGIDLTIYQGETVGIIGANGAGKSTLLKLLSRVTAPSKGSIDVYGRVASMLEVGVGFHRELTGRENIYMNGAILGMTKKEVAEVIDDIIEFSEVGEFIDTPVKRYSSGMYIRLAFAVAAHLNSEILVCDEILAVGDMAFQTKCLDKMKSAAAVEGRTVLYVSHNMNTIRRLCERCIVLDEGRVIFDGEVDAGIAVYMDRSLSENEVDIDLSAKSRGKSGVDRGVLMRRLELVDKAVPVYAADEDLCVRLTVDVAGAVGGGAGGVAGAGAGVGAGAAGGVRWEHMRVRLTLRNESDVAVGTSWSPEFTLEPGENVVCLRLPLAPLAKGTFYASVGVYEDLDQGFGRRRCIDEIARAFRIELPGVPLWRTTDHGYVSFEEMELMDTQ